MWRHNRGAGLVYQGPRRYEAEMDGSELRLPTLAPWMRNLLVALFAAYVAELALANAGVDVYALAWRPFGAGFAPWQPLTRFAVQGRRAVTVVVALLALFFMLPALWERIDRRILGRALLAAAVGATVLPLVADLALTDRGVVMGWTAVALVWLPTLFGLALPDETLYLMFAIPVSGRMLLWLTAVFTGLLALFGAPADLGSVEPFGAWLGIAGWWHLLGPGARRRRLVRQAASIERELRRFQVIEGGRAQGDQDREPDEWIH